MYILLKPSFFVLLILARRSAILKIEETEPRPARRQRSIGMISREVTVRSSVGLHARPATFFIQKANTYKSSIWVEKDERRVNAKSLLGILSLGVTEGTAITLLADGDDEEAALNGLTEMIENGFKID